MRKNEIVRAKRNQVAIVRRGRRIMHAIVSEIAWQVNELKKCRKNNVKSNRIQKKQKIKASVKFRGFCLRDIKYEILFFDGCYKIKIITFNIGSN